MTTVLELAERAGLPAETVLRVLLREPASSDARERVEAAVAELGVPDYPRPDGHVEVVDEPGEELAAADASLADELREVFRDVVDGLDRERRERVNDVALTMQLITDGWTSVDRRLGRLEKMIERIERHSVPERNGTGRRAPANGNGNGVPLRRRPPL